MCVERKYFFKPVSTVESPEDLAMATFTMGPKGIGTISLWSLITIGILIISNILYMVALLTNGWGGVDITYKGDRGTDHWDFGLWQCCRHSDGLCIGPSWPSYYSATRAMGVLALFGHVLNGAWLVGHTLEKVLDYDPCSLGTFVAISFLTSIFVSVQVGVFGTNWGDDMKQQFEQEVQAIDTNLSYSYGLACATIPLMLVAGILTIVELRTSLLRLAHEHPVVEVEREDLGDTHTYSGKHRNRKQSDYIAVLPIDEIQDSLIEELS